MARRPWVIAIALLAAAVGACGNPPSQPAGTAGGDTGPAGASPTVTGPGGSVTAPSPAAAGSCPLEVTVAPSPAPGATPNPYAIQLAYVDIARDLNDAARRELGRLQDAAATLETRREAVGRLAAAERCFAERLDLLTPEADAGARRATLLEASGAVLRELEQLSGAESASALEGGLPALRQRYRVTGEAAAAFRQAIERAYVPGWGREPASIAVGPPIEPPGELWFQSGGWSINWSGTSGSGSYSLGVANPWDAIAVDVTVHVWLVAEDGTDYAPPASVLVGSVGPGETAARTVSIQPRPGLLLKEVLGDVRGAATWYALASEALAGR